MKRIDTVVDADTPDGVRLDLYLSDDQGFLTRSQLKNRASSILVNGKIAKLSKRLSPGDQIVVEYEEELPLSYEPEDIPLDIVFEDNDVVVVNKPQGMVVHPAAGNHTGTLVQGLMYRYASLADRFDGDIVRPGIVHRLDKDTSGIILAAKHPDAQRIASDQFRKKRVKKQYVAIAKGYFSEQHGEIRTLLSRDPGNRKKFTWKTDTGKKAVTKFKVLRQYEKCALICLYPETGRTHQLRVHMLSIGHPILGDPIYSRQDNILPDATLMLHAHRLTISLPFWSDPRTFRAPLPQHIKTMLMKIALV